MLRIFSRAPIFFALLITLLVVADGRACAERPDISAREKYFDIFKGGYVLKGDVRVAMNNHGFKATIAADEAFVSLTRQCCWAEGHVKLEQETITFGCERAYVEWSTRTARVKGSVKFNKKNSVAINSDTAIFNWQTEIVDFYGAVKLDGKSYRHVRYNVVKDKVLARDKTFDAPEVIIPDSG